MDSNQKKYKLDTDNLIDKFIEFCDKSNFKVNNMEDGRIYACRLDGDKNYYISTGIHGNEPAGPIAVTAMMKMNLYPKDANVLIFPCLNPDGFKRGTRSDDKGIDLNRDYKLEKSEKTKLHKKIINKFGIPDISIILHEDWESDGFYMYDQCDKDVVDHSEELINKISKSFPINKHKNIDHHKAKSGIINVEKNKSCRKKCPEAVWLWTKGCPQNYTLETPSEFDILDRVKTQIKACTSLFRLTQ